MDLVKEKNTCDEGMKGQEAERILYTALTEEQVVASLKLT